MQTKSEEIFCVADVRRRLNDHLFSIHKKLDRDPDDPSGLYYMEL